MTDEEQLSWVVAQLRGAGCVFAEDEAQLLAQAAASSADLLAMVERRAGGEPLEQVLGWAELAGLRILVSPGVFVPRRRSELLVREAVALTEPGAVVVDLCCGSGAVGAAVAYAVGPIELHAADIDPVAVACAHRNLDGLGAHVHQGDLFAALPTTLRGRVDVLVVNAPYVPTDQLGLLPPEARVHEPRVALDGGSDGIEVQRRVAEEAPDWLAPAGHLLIETSERQSPLTVAAFAENGLSARVSTSDDLDATVVIGQRRWA